MSTFESLSDPDPEQQAQLDIIAKELVDPGLDADPELRQTLLAFLRVVDNPKRCLPPIRLE